MVLKRNDQTLSMTLTPDVIEQYKNEARNIYSTMSYRDLLRNKHDLYAEMIHFTRKFRDLQQWVLDCGKSDFQNLTLMIDELKLIQPSYPHFQRRAARLAILLNYICTKIQSFERIDEWINRANNTPVTRDSSTGYPLRCFQ